MTTLPVIIEDKTPNPLICKSGVLMYWGSAAARDPVGGMVWASLIGTNGVRSGKSPWTIVGISLDQKSATIKAKERAIWESTKN